MSPVCSSIHFLKVTFNGWEWTVLDNFQTCRDSVVPCVYWLKEEGKSDGDSNNFSTVYSKQPNLTICEPWTIFWFETWKATHFKVLKGEMVLLVTDRPPSPTHICRLFGFFQSSVSTFWIDDTGMRQSWLLVISKSCKRAQLSTPSALCPLNQMSATLEGQGASKEGR